MTLRNHYTHKLEEFREMTREEVEALRYGERVWFLALKGDAVEVKVNGAVKLWKRDKERIEVPVKYGMWECGRLNQNDIHRLLVKV